MTTKKCLFLLIISGLIVYSVSLFNGFVWDDEEQIINNQVVHSLKNLPQFFTGSTFNAGGREGLTGVYYRPIMMIFFSLLYQLFGATPFFFHFFQLVFHILTTLLLFYLFRRFFSEKMAFFLSLVFLVHPANTESVVYISAIQDVFYVFFGLLAFYRRSLFLASLAILGSLLSKEVGFLFIIFFLLYNFLFVKKAIFPYSAAFMVVGAFYLILRLGVGQVFFTPYDFAPIVQTSFVERLFMLPAIFFSYLKLFFFPLNLAVMQHWVVKEELIFSLLFFGVSLSYLVKTRDKKFLFFFLWYLLAVFPYLQLFPLDMTVAERWFYLPMIGMLGMVGGAAQKLVDSVRFFPPASAREKLRAVGSPSKPATYQFLLLFIGIIVVVLLSIRTFARILNWRNGLTLFSHDIKISKNSFDLENNLGVELFRAGRMKEAKIHFEKSTKLAPSWWTNWNNLGAVYEKDKDLETAKKYYQKAIDNGNYYLAYENYAGILIKQKRYDKAKEFLEKEALPRLPTNEKLRQFYLYLTSEVK